MSKGSIPHPIDQCNTLLSDENHISLQQEDLDTKQLEKGNSKHQGQ